MRTTIETDRGTITGDWHESRYRARHHGIAGTVTADDGAIYDVLVPPRHAPPGEVLLIIMIVVLLAGAGLLFMLELLGLQ